MRGAEIRLSYTSCTYCYDKVSLQISKGVFHMKKKIGAICLVMFHPWAVNKIWQHQEFGESSGGHQSWIWRHFGPLQTLLPILFFTVIQRVFPPCVWLFYSVPWHCHSTFTRQSPGTYNGLGGVQTWLLQPVQKLHETHVTNNCCVFHLLIIKYLDPLGVLWF